MADISGGGGGASGGAHTIVTFFDGSGTLAAHKAKKAREARQLVSQNSTTTSLFSSKTGPICVPFFQRQLRIFSDYLDRRSIDRLICIIGEQHPLLRDAIGEGSFRSRCYGADSDDPALPCTPATCKSMRLEEASRARAALCRRFADHLGRLPPLAGHPLLTFSVTTGNEVEQLVFGREAGEGGGGDAAAAWLEGDPLPAKPLAISPAHWVFSALCAADTATPAPPQNWEDSEFVSLFFNVSGGGLPVASIIRCDAAADDFAASVFALDTVLSIPAVFFAAFGNSATEFDSETARLAALLESQRLLNVRANVNIALDRLFTCINEGTSSGALLASTAAYVGKLVGLLTPGAVSESSPAAKLLFKYASQLPLEYPLAFRRLLDFPVFSLALRPAVRTLSVVTRDPAGASLGLFTAGEGLLHGGLASVLFAGLRRPPLPRLLPVEKFGDALDVLTTALQRSRGAPRAIILLASPSQPAAHLVAGGGGGGGGGGGEGEGAGAGEDGRGDAVFGADRAAWEAANVAAEAVPPSCALPGDAGQFFKRVALPYLRDLAAGRGLARGEAGWLFKPELWLDIASHGGETLGLLQALAVARGVCATLAVDSRAVWVDEQRIKRVLRALGSGRGFSAAMMPFADDAKPTDNLLLGLQAIRGGWEKPLSAAPGVPGEWAALVRERTAEAGDGSRRAGQAERQRKRRRTRDADGAAGAAERTRGSAGGGGSASAAESGAPVGAERSSGEGQDGELLDGQEEE